MTRKTRKTHFQKYKKYVHMANLSPTSVHHAMYCRDVERLKELVRYAPPKYFQKCQDCVFCVHDAPAPCHLLVHLARSGVKEEILYPILRLLVQGGADFNAAEPHTALHMAVRSPQIDVKFIETLIIEAGADVNATHCLFCITPLEEAMQIANFKAMACLIDNGADWMVLQNDSIVKEKVFFDEERHQYVRRVDYSDLNLFLAHAPEVGDAILRRKRKMLTETAIGLCSMDLPVLCVVEIASWLIEDFMDAEPTAMVCWDICKTVKHH